MFCNAGKRWESDLQREIFESKPLDGNTHSSWRIDSVAVSLFVSSDRSSHSDDVLLSAPTGRVAGDDSLQSRNQSDSQVLTKQFGWNPSDF